MEINKENILISACLMGVKCRYDGKLVKNRLNNYEKVIINSKYNLVPVCPEQLGGLPTPRLPSEIIGGDGADYFNHLNVKVINKNNDVTDNFVKGALECYKIAKLSKTTIMVTVNKSPSCSNKLIYDGNFSGNLIRGIGFTVAFLQKKLDMIFIDVNDFRIYFKKKWPYLKF